MITASVDCNSEHSCCFNSNFATREHGRVTLSNFYKFDQLKFDCPTPINMSIWEICPFEPAILDETLDLTGLSIQSDGQGLLVFLKNLKGFDLKTNPFEEMHYIHSDTEAIQWFIDRTTFEFYLKGSPLKMNECNTSLTNNGIFSKARLMDFKRVKLVPNLCSFAFNNFRVYTLSIDRVGSSFIEENMLSFDDIPAGNLRSEIMQLNLITYHIDINNKLLNKYVFKNLLTLDLNGPINSIQFVQIIQWIENASSKITKHQENIC